ncbi:unnamed protein product [Amoebophrya sp. A120]|nr:unnamed protein product [Amoebophrya sp. A120]|eukprot:GSA120T00000928001.1
MLPGADNELAQKHVPDQNELHILLSTNICETGVTLPKLLCVVDIGLQKCEQFHQVSRAVQLQRRPATEAQKKQRRGRVGRVQPGFYFPLYFRKNDEDLPARTRRASESRAAVPVNKDNVSAEISTTGSYYCKEDSLTSPCSIDTLPDCSTQHWQDCDRRGMILECAAERALMLRGLEEKIQKVFGSLNRKELLQADQRNKLSKGDEMSGEAAAGRACAVSQELNFAMKIIAGHLANDYLYAGYVDPVCRRRFRHWDARSNKWVWEPVGVDVSDDGASAGKQAEVLSVSTQHDHERHRCYATLAMLEDLQLRLDGGGGKSTANGVDRGLWLVLVRDCDRRGLLRVPVREHPESARDGETKNSIVSVGDAVPCSHDGVASLGQHGEHLVGSSAVRQQDEDRRDEVDEGSTSSSLLRAARLFDSFCITAGDDERAGQDRYKKNKQFQSMGPDETPLEIADSRADQNFVEMSIPERVAPDCHDQTADNKSAGAISSENDVDNSGRVTSTPLPPAVTAALRGSSADLSTQDLAMGHTSSCSRGAGSSTTIGQLEDQSRHASSYKQQLRNYTTQLRSSSILPSTFGLFVHTLPCHDLLVAQLIATAVFLDMPQDGVILGAILDGSTHSCCVEKLSLQQRFFDPGYFDHTTTSGEDNAQDRLRFFAESVRKRRSRWELVERKIAARKAQQQSGKNTGMGGRSFSSKTASGHGSVSRNTTSEGLIDGGSEAAFFSEPLDIRCRIIQMLSDDRLQHMRFEQRREFFEPDKEVCAEAAANILDGITRIARALLNLVVPNHRERWRQHWLQERTTSRTSLLRSSNSTVSAQTDAEGRSSSDKHLQKRIVSESFTPASSAAASSSSSFAAQSESQALSRQTQSPSSCSWDAGSFASSGASSHQLASNVDRPMSAATPATEARGLLDEVPSSRTQPAPIVVTADMLQSRLLEEQQSADLRKSSASEAGIKTELSSTTTGRANKSSSNFASPLSVWEKRLNALASLEYDDRSQQLYDFQPAAVLIQLMASVFCAESGGFAVGLCEELYRGPRGEITAREDQAPGSRSAVGPDTGLVASAPLCPSNGLLTTSEEDGFSPCSTIVLPFKIENKDDEATAAEILDTFICAKKAKQANRSNQHRRNTKDETEGNKGGAEKGNQCGGIISENFAITAGEKFLDEAGKSAASPTSYLDLEKMLCANNKRQPRVITFHHASKSASTANRSTTTCKNQKTDHHHISTRLAASRTTPALSWALSPECETLMRLQLLANNRMQPGQHRRLNLFKNREPLQILQAGSSGVLCGRRDCVTSWHTAIWELKNDCDVSGRGPSDADYTSSTNKKKSALDVVEFAGARPAKENKFLHRSRGVFVSVPTKTRIDWSSPVATAILPRYNHNRIGSGSAGGRISDRVLQAQPIITSSSCLFGVCPKRRLVGVKEIVASIGMSVWPADRPVVSWMVQAGWNVEDIVVLAHMVPEILSTDPRTQLRQENCDGLLAADAEDELARANTTTVNQNSSARPTSSEATTARCISILGLVHALPSSASTRCTRSRTNPTSGGTSVDDNAALLLLPTPEPLHLIRTALEYRADFRKMCFGSFEDVKGVLLRRNHKPHTAADRTASTTTTTIATDPRAPPLQWQKQIAKAGAKQHLQSSTYYSLHRCKQLFHELGKPLVGHEPQNLDSSSKGRNEVADHDHREHVEHELQDTRTHSSSFRIARLSTLLEESEVGGKGGTINKGASTRTEDGFRSVATAAPRISSSHCRSGGEGDSAVEVEEDLSTIPWTTLADKPASWWTEQRVHSVFAAKRENGLIYGHVQGLG